jgi:hypothetical protein
VRLIDEHISFDFVRQQLKDSYSETDPPSIDSELLLRILLIGYLCGITSERKLALRVGIVLPENDNVEETKHFDGPTPVQHKVVIGLPPTLFGVQHSFCVLPVRGRD